MTGSKDDALTELQARVVELEIRNAYQDDLLRKLDDVIREFAMRTEAAEKRIQDLEQRVRDVEGGQEPETGPHDEKPPHY